MTVVSLWSELDFRKVGCALCHIKDDRPMMYIIPPMDYPGLRDARAELRLHGECHALLVNIIGAALFTGIRGAGTYNFSSGLDNSPETEWNFGGKSGYHPNSQPTWSVCNRPECVMYYGSEHEYPTNHAPVRNAHDDRH